MISSAKRKRGCDSHAADGVVEAAAERDSGAADLGRADASSNGSTPGQSNGKQLESAASEVTNASKLDRADEQGVAAQQQEIDGGAPAPAGRCECLCFCGRGVGAYSHTAGRNGADAGSRSIARVGTASADLSRVEQLVGGAAMVRGCALGVGFVARATDLSPGLSVSGALDLLDAATAARDNSGGGEKEGGEEGGKSAGGGGFMSLVFGGGANPAEGFGEQDKSAAMASFCGGPLVALPRRFEVAAALHRLPGVKFRPAAAAAAAAAAAVADTMQTSSPAETVEEDA